MREVGVNAGAANAPAPARLFVALWPNAAVRKALAACRDACTWPAGAAVVATPKLHMTLHFIGEVAADRLVCGVVMCIVAQLRAMNGEFDVAAQLCRQGRTMLQSLGDGVAAARQHDDHAEGALDVVEPDGAVASPLRQGKRLLLVHHRHAHLLPGGQVEIFLARRTLGEG